MSGKGREKYLEFLNSDEWKNQSAETLDRSSGFCEFCGDVAVNAHHVKYPKKYEENNPNNLVAVCKKCHELSHGIRNTDKIVDAKIMTDLAPKGVRMRYLLTEGRIYASAKSWTNALQVPEKLKAWFVTGLARTSALKQRHHQSKLEMEFNSVLVYRWHVVAEQLRVFDRQWYQHQFSTRPRFEREKIKKFHENYELIVAWGYDLQEKALNSLINQTDGSNAITPEDLQDAVNEAVSPKLYKSEYRLEEHDTIITEIKSTVPTFRDLEEFITVKQAIIEQGLDSNSMPCFPNSRENLSGLVGQMLVDKNATRGERVKSRTDGTSLSIEFNTYRRGDIYKTLQETAKIQVRQQSLL